MKPTQISIFVALFFGATFAFTNASKAHRTSASLTTIVWVEADKSFEITHRLHLHDVQQALRNVIAGPHTTAFDPEGQAELILYMEDTFQLTTPNGDLNLSPLGAEVEGDYVYIYQEANSPSLPNALSVTDLTFSDIYPEQENQVNVEYGETITSLIFNASDETSKSVKLK